MVEADTVGISPRYGARKENRDDGDGKV